LGHEPDQIVGHTDKVEVTAQRIKVAGVISGVGDAAQEVTALAANGFPWQCSIGASVQSREYVDAGKTVTVNGRNFSGPVMVARKSTLGEVSFVPIGADQNTSAVVAAQQENAVNFESWLKAAGVDVATLSDAAKKLLQAQYDAEMKAKNSPPVVPPNSNPGTGPTAADVRAEIDREIEAGRKRAREASAAEERRITEIRAAVGRHKVETVEVEADGKKAKVNLIAHAVENNWTADQAELHALRAARPTVGVAGGLAYTTTTPDVSEAVLEAAVFEATRCELFDEDFFTAERGERSGGIRPRDRSRIKNELNARYTDQVRQAAHTLFKGRMGLQQMLTIIARQGGYRGTESVGAHNLGEVAGACMRIEADGSSTISVQNVTANVLNKFMLVGFLYTEQSWKEVAAIRSVKDFKPTKSINLFGDVIFKDVGNSGELDNATLQDQAFANSVKTRGRIITIPRTLIINDDLGGFGQIPTIFGRGAGLKLNDVFWAKLLNPGLDDGGSTNFFAATHTLPAGQSGNSNLSSGAGSALSSAGLTAAVLLFDNQIDPTGFPLGIDPEILLYPSDLNTVALELMNSEWIVQSAGATTKQPSSNIWKGRFKPVKSRYMNKAAYTGNSAAAWYLFGNPNIVPVIEAAFLNGVDMPVVQQAGPDFQFNLLGISTRAFFDMDVNMQNFRGAVKSNGS
jgi:hypothetical protein